MRVEYLIIHCTATKEGKRVTGDDIRNWHLSPVSEGGRGWKQVGYRQLIRLDGIEKLVGDNGDEFIDPWEITNGVAGYNSKSIHICYAGGLDENGKPKDTRNPLQKRLMEGVVLNYIKKYPWIKVGGHYQLDKNKACPCFDVPKWLKGIGVTDKNILR